jgi:hypothetical protein
MRILKKIFIILLGIVVVFLAVAYLFGKSNCHVERSIIVNQKQLVSYNFLNDLQNWNKWSPWYERDPNAKFTFSGPTSGKGASLAWASEKNDVGHGSLTITDSQPDSLILIDLNFMENGVAKSGFHLTPEGEGAKIKWTFDVEMGMNPIGRVMGLLMDSMLGKDYEKGLEGIKKNVESIPNIES